MIEKLNRLGDMHSDLHVGDNGSNCKLPLVPVRHLYFHPVPEFVLKYLERLRINCVLETYPHIDQHKSHTYSSTVLVT